jgi:hypothetical protein
MTVNDWAMKKKADQSGYSDKAGDADADNWQVV